MEIPKELQEQVKEIFATLKEKVVLKVLQKKKIVLIAKIL